MRERMNNDSDSDRSVSGNRGRARLYLALSFLAFALLANPAQAANADASANPRGQNAWMQEHLLSEQPQLPFSFVYDRQGSSALLKSWPKKMETQTLDSVRTKHVMRWTDPKSGLQVRLEALEFANSPVVEWTAYFKNDGATDSAMLEYVQALDVSFAVSGEGIPTILYSKGCGVMDTYALLKKPLNQLESFEISNESGGKTVETIPFFDVDDSGTRPDRRLGMAGKVGHPFLASHRGRHCDQRRHGSHASVAPSRRGNSHSRDAAAALGGRRYRCAQHSAPAHSAISHAAIRRKAGGPAHLSPGMGRDEDLHQPAA